MNCQGFSAPADVNRALWGGGVPGAAHTALSGSRSRCRSSRRSSTVGIFSGGPSGSSNSSGCPFFQASDTQLPLLKNLPTIATLLRRTFWAIRTSPPFYVGGKVLPPPDRVLVDGSVVGDDEGTITALDSFFSRVSCFPSCPLSVLLVLLEGIVHFVSRCDLDINDDLPPFASGVTTESRQVRLQPRASNAPFHLPLVGP